MIPEHLRQEIEHTIQSTAFRAAVQELASELYADWQMTGPDELDKREDLWRRQRVLIDVVQKLQDMSQPGVG